MSEHPLLNAGFLPVTAQAERVVFSPGRTCRSVVVAVAFAEATVLA